MSEVKFKLPIDGLSLYSSADSFCFDLSNLIVLKTTRSGLANYVERLIGQLCEITINVQFPSHDSTRRVD